MSQYRTVPDDYDWEPYERLLVRRHVRPEDRVLELGTAIGATAITAASIVGGDSVLTIDANPKIMAKARENFKAEELPIHTKIGICRNRHKYNPSERVKFYIAEQFVDSRLIPDTLPALFDDAYDDDVMSDIVGVVRSRTMCLEDLIAEFRATVLICDIEGGETELLTGADLSGLRLIILETHPVRGGTEEAVEAMFAVLKSQQFGILDHPVGTVMAWQKY